MWLINKGGFVSLVQHKDDPSKIRARARRREHLIETLGAFFVDEEDIIDFGEDASDYRWHLDLSRDVVAAAMVNAIMDITYSSHAKEAMSEGDEQMYSALLGCWRELYRLQR